MTALPDWDIVSDAELVCAAAAGDRRAFAGIYDRYADRLHDFCVGMLRDRDAAADCVQDVFCAAADRLSQLREADKLRPWLYAIARNECLRCIRARSRERVYDEVPEAESAEPGPDTMAARSELANLVAEAAGGLSDRDRSVLELAYRHGLDGPELAEALGVSATNAKKMAQRLRDTIERSLGALLVSRRVRSNPNACPELAAILDGWDGQFTVLMRKRISRHIESCPICDEERRRMVSPVALLGGVPVFIPAPEWLRERTLDKVNFTPAGHAAETQEAQAQAEAAPDDGSKAESSRPAWSIAVFAAALMAMAGLASAWLYQHHDAHVAPARVIQTVSPTQAPRIVAPSSTTPPPPSEGPVTTTIPPITTEAPTVPTSALPPPVTTTVPPVTVVPPAGPSSGTSKAPVFTPPTEEPTQPSVTSNPPITEEPTESAPPPSPTGPTPTKPTFSRPSPGPVKPPPATTTQGPIIY